MDYIHFLDERLNLARYVYGITAPVFEEIKRKIENYEPPYDDTGVGDPEQASDEPLFFEEWERADSAIDVLGMSCLGIVQTALHTFLKTFVRDTWGPQSLAEIGKMAGSSWFAKYKAAFTDDPDLGWENSGVDLALMEQLILTRNDFMHQDDLIISFTRQDRKHAQAYPMSRFQHAAWPSFDGRARLVVTREQLEECIASVKTLAIYLVEGVRAWRKRRAAERNRNS